MCRIERICLLILLSLTVSSEEIWGKETYEIGGTSRTWEEAGTLDLLEIEEGAIHPLHFEPDENVLPTIQERNGRIFAIHASGEFIGAKFEGAAENWVRMVDGDPETAFSEHVTVGSGVYGPTFYFDLGGVIPLHRIRFYPRTDYSFRALPVFEMAVNDGRPEHLGERNIPFTQNVVLFRPRTIRGEILQEISFPRQPVQYIILHPLLPTGRHFWEIAEMEAYGEGYVPEASYLSDFIDLEDLASWGEIRWTGWKDRKAKVQIHTRTGLDDDPERFWRKTGRAGQLSSTRPTGEPLTREDYDQLPSLEKGPITYDTENWSFWSAPYDFEAGSSGVGIVSPGPRRYLQIRIDFTSTWTDAAHLEWLSFNYSKPPVATDIMGEVWPDEVALGERTRFTYALSPRLRPTDLGFDGVELVTHTPADTVRSVRLGGEEVPFSVSYLKEPARFIVAFAEHRIAPSENVEGIEIEFDVSVFRYSTDFTARVLDTQSDEVSQLVRPGNATVRIPSDGISVRTSLREGTIGTVSALPRTITPNGDGINDLSEIRYDLFKLTYDTEVELSIHALSGERMRLLYRGFEMSGRHRRVWDGMDKNGRHVPPGMYIYVMKVHTDEGVERRVGTVCVAY